MKYLYLVEDTRNEDLGKALDHAGSGGWELVQIFPVNEIMPLSLGSKPIMKSYLRCVFKKPNPDAS